MNKNKPKLIMIPGLICDERLFRRQIADLEYKFDISVVNHARDLSLSQLAIDILDSVEGGFSLLGLSMGGYICFEVMRQAKLRGQDEKIIKLVLCSTSARVDEPEIAKRRLDFIALAKRGKFKGMSPMLMRTFIHPSNLEDSSIVKTINAMALSTGSEGFIYETNMVLGRPDSRPDLANISCPTLVMCGDGDERTPLYLSEEMAGLIPNTKLVVFKDCGHLPPLEKPNMVSEELLKFL
jgi:pimeloyl-ACP methyl ester carboxylesterase